MNYVDATLERLDEHCPGLHPDLRMLYALLVLVTGPETTLRHVHDAWSLHITGTRPEHPALVPFDDLDAETQQLDEPYRAAIAAACAVTP